MSYFHIGGDLAGSMPNPTVTKIRGVNVSAVAPTSQQVLSYNSGTSQWEAATSLGGPPSGPAGGALAGNYPNPTVVNISFANNNIQIGPGANTNSGTSCTAIGTGAVANFTTGATAVGASTFTQGANGTCIGFGAGANADATSLGANASASAQYSTAFGSGADAVGNHSIAIGYQSKGGGSIVIGSGAQSVYQGRIVLGRDAVDTGFGAMTLRSDVATIAGAVTVSHYWPVVINGVKYHLPLELIP